MHDYLAEKLLLFEKLLLRHDYHDLLLLTKPEQLREKALRIVRLKEEQIKLLDDLLKDSAGFAPDGTPVKRHFSD